jgi:para-nitrobenzyl esterase
VNIYTPKTSIAKKYPVLLWIHGGGLTSGDGHLDIHSIVRNYVSKEVVVASIGYRLNFLGNNNYFSKIFYTHI